MMPKKLENAKRLYALKIHQTLPNYRRYLFDSIFSTPAKLTAIYGSRGVGKTTMILQLLQASPLEASKKLYISCEQKSVKP